MNLQAVTGLKIARYLLMVGGLLVLGACTSSGLIPVNVNLALSDVKVVQAGKVRGGAKFSHDLREQIRYEFSRARSKAKYKKNVRLTLEVHEMAARRSIYSGVQKFTGKAIRGFGRLVDASNSQTIGEFALRVNYRTDGKGSNRKTRKSRANINHSKLIKLIARATFEKVYGRSRAAKMTKNHAGHVRRSYNKPKPKSIKVASLPKNPKKSNAKRRKPTIKVKSPDLVAKKKAPELPVKVKSPVVAKVKSPQPTIVEAPIEQVIIDEKPIIIEAPQLPIQ